jgi:feruloyl-CoA synthase
MDGTSETHAPFRDARYAPRALEVERRGDVLILKNPTPLFQHRPDRHRAAVSLAVPGAAPRLAGERERRDGGQGWRR